MLQNPAKYMESANKALLTNKKKRSSYKRTRRRVETPKQTYLYAWQRKLQQQDSNSTAMMRNSNNNSTATTTTTSMNEVVRFAKELGMPFQQHCDPDPSATPKIVAKIRVVLPEKEDDQTTDDTTNHHVSSWNQFAYILEKPPGWCILGSKSSDTKKQKQDSRKKKGLDNDKIHRITVREDDGSVDVLEYSERDILAQLTPEEREEYLSEMRTEDGLFLESNAEEESDSDHEQSNILSNGGALLDETLTEEEKLQQQNPQRLANLRRIQARLSDIANSSSSSTARGSSTIQNKPRPSLVSWLRETLASENEGKSGVVVKGGNYWKAIAGATDPDDSGLVILCPKIHADNLFVEGTQYIAVVGNGGFMAPIKNTKQPPNSTLMAPQEETIQTEVLAKLKTGRGMDVVETVRVLIPERRSTCTDVVGVCQNEFKDGIRGDPIGNPLERRAPRRLIHCQSMSVSSLCADENVQVSTESLPDDIAILSSRQAAIYEKGSFLGRSSLRKSALTTAYREINGAADGFPGWTVDRYGKWLLVYHNDPEKNPRGPLPSIHDGFTAGVYYLPTYPDRSHSMKDIRPRLIEGKAAPDIFPIVENGVSYLVSLDKDLSTGIFLDQRLQRAWLTRNCGPETRVLNCFAHTGAFSVAAAAAGASTVSLDLSRKWLERLPEHFQANGLEFDERHDCIHGDCFEWLVKLAKRGEKYDIVIIDPPSTSVGGRKKKRWSIKNDMDELVTLAAVLVKEGGLLWTTTNSGSIPAFKFAQLCYKGLNEAVGHGNTYLERVQPMPADFPSIGPQPVKNLVWRLM